MTEQLASLIAEELPRARRRMWVLLAVGIASMAALLIVGIVLMLNTAGSHP